MRPVQRKRKREGAIGADSADRAKTKTFWRNAEEHPSVTRAKLQIDELVRLFLGKSLLVNFHDRYSSNFNPKFGAGRG